MEITLTDLPQRPVDAFLHEVALVGGMLDNQRKESLEEFIDAATDDNLFVNTRVLLNMKEGDVMILMPERMQEIWKELETAQSMPAFEEFLSDSLYKEEFFDVFQRVAANGRGLIVTFD